jgi:hypothetical protein
MLFNNAKESLKLIYIYKVEDKNKNTYKQNDFQTNVYVF